MDLLTHNACGLNASLILYNLLLFINSQCLPKLHSTIKSNEILYPSVCKFKQTRIKYISSFNRKKLIVAKYQSGTSIFQAVGEGEGGMWVDYCTLTKGFLGMVYFIINTLDLETNLRL